MTATDQSSSDARVSTAANLTLLSKVPQITAFFWIIKILCTTVGETASDFLNVNLNLGLTGTSIAMGLLLAVALVVQLRATKYVPGLYWTVVVLISVFGTLLTDILTDTLDVPLEASTIVFSVALAATFAVWFAGEKTLAMHSIFTRRREVFYWLAILFTFALGTASGDLMAERLGLGYLVTGLIVLAVIAIVVAGWSFGLDAVLAFWIAYILTRPLGASIGDYLTQPAANGGLALGAMVTSLIFTAAIVLTVIFLSVTRKDVLRVPTSEEASQKNPRMLFAQIAVTSGVLIAVSIGSYFWYESKLRAQAPVATSATSPLGDLSAFRKIARDTLALVETGKLADAEVRITDLETAWDSAEARLLPMNHDQWKVLDGTIDRALRQLRSNHPDASRCDSAMKSLLNEIDTLDKHT